MIETKLSQQRSWHFCENGHVKLETDKKLENKLKIYRNLEIKLEIYGYFKLEFKLEMFQFFVNGR